MVINHCTSWQLISSADSVKLVVTWPRLPVPSCTRIGSTLRRSRGHIKQVLSDPEGFEFHKNDRFDISRRFCSSPIIDGAADIGESNRRENQPSSIIYSLVIHSFSHDESNKSICIEKNISYSLLLYVLSTKSLSKRDMCSESQEYLYTCNCQH